MRDVFLLCFVHCYLCFLALFLSYCMWSASYLESGLAYNQVIRGISSHDLQAENQSNLLQNLLLQSVHKPKPRAWSAALPVESTKLLPHEKIHSKICKTEDAEWSKETWEESRQAEVWHTLPRTNKGSGHILS